MVFDIGRVCMKVAGRDSNKIAVVIKKIDDSYVLVDGNVRRKKCNIMHLEPLNKVLKIREEESGDKIKELLLKEGFKVDKKGNKKEKKELLKDIKKRTSINNPQ